MKLPFATPEEFLARYGTHLTQGGIYLRAKAVKEPGTAVRLELKLQSGERLLHAAAVVQFVTAPAVGPPTGMGLRFTQVDPETQRFLDSAVVTLPHAKSNDAPLPPGVGSPRYAPGEEPRRHDALPTVAPLPSTPKPVTPASSSPPVMSRAVAVTSASAPVASAPSFEETPLPAEKTGPVIGIDLGTTNSCAGFVQKGKPRVLPSREGHNTVPSIIALNSRGKLVIGHPAKGQMLTNPRQTVYGAKRLVGRDFDSPVVQQMKDRFAYEVASGAQGEAAVKLGDRTYSLQQISAMVLREVKELAQNQLGHPVCRAVITVPAYYSDNQRQAVRDAGRMAGLHVERILNEPTAAALAYGWGRKLKERILVYDLGGGTFDASVLELHDNVYEVVSTGGDTFLGGIDFDNAIVSHLLDQFAQKAGRPFQGDRVAMQRITDAAERAKCALSERSETRVHVPFITLIDNQPYDMDVTLKRETLVALTHALVERTLQVCDEVLKAKQLAPKDIDEVVLVGGQSRSPLVHEKIEAFFGKPPSKGVHPDEAVALGAALFASSLGQAEGVVLIDVLPMAIGVALPGGRFKPVLERNTALPATRRHVLATHRDGQTDLELTVFQGDSDRIADNEYLGTLRLRGLPPGPRGTVKVEVTFEVSNESLLKVTAKETSTGKMVSATLFTRDTPDAVRDRMRTLSEPSMAAVPAAPSSSDSESAGAPGTLNGAPPGSAHGGLFGWLRRLFRPGPLGSGRR
ncbi:MAG: TIGR02266 family protein [Myxococcaceae bacterium]